MVSFIGGGKWRTWRKTTDLPYKSQTNIYHTCCTPRPERDGIGNTTYFALEMAIGTCTQKKDHDYPFFGNKFILWKIVEKNKKKRRLVKYYMY